MDENEAHARQIENAVGTLIAAAYPKNIVARIMTALGVAWREARDAIPKDPETTPAAAFVLMARGLTGDSVEPTKTPVTLAIKRIAAAFHSIGVDPRRIGSIVLYDSDFELLLAAMMTESDLPELPAGQKARLIELEGVTFIRASSAVSLMRAAQPADAAPSPKPTLN